MKQVILIATIILGMCSYGFRNSQYGIGLDRNPEKSLRRIDRSGKASLAAIIDREADINAIPRSILRGLISVESKFNATNFNKEVSLCGKHPAWDGSKCASWGLTGIVYGWHKQECRLYDWSELLDPETNVECGAKILGANLQRRHGQLVQALNDYNGDKTGRYAERVLREAKHFEG